MPITLNDPRDSEIKALRNRLADYSVQTAPGSSPDLQMIQILKEMKNDSLELRNGQIEPRSSNDVAMSVLARIADKFDKSDAKQTQLGNDIERNKQSSDKQFSELQGKLVVSEEKYVSMSKDFAQMKVSVTKMEAAKDAADRLRDNPESLERFRASSAADVNLTDLAQNGIPTEGPEGDENGIICGFCYEEMEENPSKVSNP